MCQQVDSLIRDMAGEYNNLCYFENDPIIFPRHFAELMKKGEATLQDVEIAAILSAHLAWGKRTMIIRDCKRLFDEMAWMPYSYIMGGDYRNSATALHRTIKWSDMARIFSALRDFYRENESLEELSAEDIRVRIFGQKPDKKAANKKIHLFFKWMVRKDGIVDIGVWKNRNAAELIIPLDVHVHRSAQELGITCRRSVDIVTAAEITDYLKGIFPEDPCMGDFALFARAASRKKK